MAKTKTKSKAKEPRRKGKARPAPAARPRSTTLPSDGAEAFERCREDPVLGSVVELARYLTEEGLDVEEVALVTGSVFYAAAVDVEVGAHTASRAADLFRALQHVGLHTRDAARTVADVLSRRLA